MISNVLRALREDKWIGVSPLVDEAKGLDEITQTIPEAWVKFKREFAWLRKL